MSYIKKEEWTILPGEAPAIRRNCSGCRKSSIFRSSGNFRMNANGNKLDVWLIYRCEKCDTSWNMDIYTRTAPGMLGQDLYNRFWKMMRIQPWNSDAGRKFSAGIRRRHYGNRYRLRWRKRSMRPKMPVRH